MTVPLLLAALCLTAQPPRPLTGRTSGIVRTSSTHTSTQNPVRTTRTSTRLERNPSDEAHRDAHRRERHRRWIGWRIYEGTREVRVKGPGALTLVQPPDGFDAALSGTWQLTAMRVLFQRDDGYGRIAPAIDTHLGWLTIGSDGHFEWDMPGETAAEGEMAEVMGSDARIDEHFWSLRGHGRTVVIAGGQNGELLLYDASTNQLIATARK